MTNRLAKEHLQIIHEINILSEQIHRAEIELTTIRNEISREQYNVYLNELKMKREELILLEYKNQTSIERKLLYEKLCFEIGKVKTDEYMKEAFKDFIMLD